MSDGEDQEITDQENDSESDNSEREVFELKFLMIMRFLSSLDEDNSDSSHDQIPTIKRTNTTEIQQAATQLFQPFTNILQNNEQTFNQLKQKPENEFSREWMTSTPT